MAVLKKITSIGIAFAVIFTVIFSMPKTVEAIPNFEEATIIAEDVNMRLRPTVDSPFVLKLANGTRVGVFCEEVDGWYRIIYGNYRGYVSKDFVFLPSTDMLVGNILADETPVYQNAGEFSEVVAKLGAGLGVTIKNIQGDYYMIEYEDAATTPQATPSAQPTAVQPSEMPSASAATATPSSVAAVAEQSGIVKMAASVTSSPSATPPSEAASASPQQTAPQATPSAQQTAVQPSASETPSVQPSESVQPSATPSATPSAPQESVVPQESTTAVKTGYIKKDSVKLSTSKNPTNLLKAGMKGVEVVKMQRKLIDRGFLDASATGDFGDKTKAAVTFFQEMAELPADGIAGAKTLEMLYGDNDIKATYAQRMGISGSVKLTPWNEVKDIFYKGATARVTDVKTGISWNEKRFGGWFHADSEPVTAEDTANMKKAYGGEWSWDRRAVWVTIDGQTFAASINGMPHLSRTISDNNFPGHHCIHFYKSKVHQTSRECPRHQAAVQYAYKKGQSA
ncbi:MAG: peptidoglycan-binding protein [Christensenellaceae bacterium]